MPHDQLDDFIEVYTDALREQNAAVFAGAGLSIPAGMVSWKDLLRNIASDIHLDVDREHDLISLAQYHVNERGGRHRINQALIQEFSRRASLTENHRLLAALPIRTYWTTNYDSLIEDALGNAGKIADVKRTVPNLAVTVPRRNAVVYKMHGDISQPHEAVLTKDDYESYESKRRLFSAALQGDLVAKTFLFIGFSFNDPNLNYVLSRIRILLGENRREHFCLLRRVQREDFASRKDFAYALAKQDLQIRDLRRYGITGLLVDDYKQYTEALQRIYLRYKLARVFISGSAATYLPWTEDKGQELIQAISQGLIAGGFGIVTGFGLGVGPYVLNGVLEELDAQGIPLVADWLVMRPFPIAIRDPAERARKWTSYRGEIVGEAGIALFLFGSKAGPNGILPASGMEEEFRIAREKKLFVVPVGCTGGTSETLHRTVLADFKSYFPFPGYRKSFEDLAKPGSPREVATRVVKFVSNLWKDRAISTRQAN